MKRPIGLQPANRDKLASVVAFVQTVCFLLLLAGTAQAFEPIYELPDVLMPDTPAGLRGVLSNRGKNVHNVGNVLMNITNYGILGSMPGSGQGFDAAASAQWPSGSRAEHLWAAGLWVGAKRFGEASVTTWEVQNGRLLLEVLPGPGPDDRIYEAQEFQAGGSRSPATRPDDDADGLIDEDRLDGVDNDQDGLVDEDFAAVSDQMLTCEYRDDDPRIQLQNPTHRPLGIHIRQTSMAWATQEIDDFIAFEYEITNVGTAPLFDVYLGYFADFDIGPLDLSASSRDDMVGFWEGYREIRVDGRTRNIKLSIGYMFDDDGDEGKSPGYIGVMFLGSRDRRPILSRPTIHFPMDLTAPVQNFQSYTRFSSAINGGKPANDQDRYALLAGTAENALGEVNPDTGLRDPIVSKQPNDYSTLLSATPFEILEPGRSISIKLAMVLGSGFEEMLQNAIQAYRLHEGIWFDNDGDARTGIGGLELQVCGPEHAGAKLNLRCCPAPVPDDCNGKVPDDGCLWTDGDCNPTTGVGGKESHLFWTGPLPPPAPNMRIVGGENQAQIFWDNRSELLPDPLSQELDFESYRVWRADGWNRPLGTTRQTGPGAEAWFLMAEYDLVNGIGWDRGLDEISYDPTITKEAVEFYRNWFQDYPEQPPPDLPGFSEAQADTAQALAQGVRYYHFVDPPFVPNGHVGDPCPPNGQCPPLVTPDGTVPTRCNDNGLCAEVTAPPKSGVHLFYGVTATDHALVRGTNGELVPNGPGMSGAPNTNFEYFTPPTEPLRPEDFGKAQQEIYVVPNPATTESMEPWSLDPDDRDPTGLKVEFHHLPLGRGHVSIYSLSGDLIIHLPFDTRAGNGTLAWNLLTRNNQEVTSGVYLFVVEADAADFERFISRFVVIR